MRDGAALLEGGELVLSTGLALSSDPADVSSYLNELIDAGACGLMIELSPAFPDVPASAIRVADQQGFALIVLRRSARFVAITEEVNRAIVAERLEQVTFGQHVHEVFTHLTLEDATPLMVVQAVGELAGSSVVLEDLRHHVVAHANVEQTDAELLGGWSSRSRAQRSKSAAEGASWIVESVGRRGQEWARLIVPSPVIARERVSMVLQRAAQALELGRMVERDLMMIELQAHGGFLVDLMDGAVGSARDAEARAHSLGLVRSPRYIPVAVQTLLNGELGSVMTHRQSRRVVERITRSVRDAQLSCLVGPLGLGSVGLLVAVPRGQREESVINRLAAAVHSDARDGSVWIGVDDGVDGVFAASAGLQRARHVASVAAATMPQFKPFYRHVDVRLRGLLSLIGTDPRVQAFAEAELQRILLYDAESDDDLLKVLRAFLAVGGNKTELARATHRSRPGLYKKLSKIETILGVELDDADSRTSLSVAMMAHDLAAQRER